MILNEEEAKKLQEAWDKVLQEQPLRAPSIYSPQRPYVCPMCSGSGLVHAILYDKINCMQDVACRSCD